MNDIKIKTHSSWLNFYVFYLYFVHSLFHCCNLCSLMYTEHNTYLDTIVNFISLLCCIIIFISPQYIFVQKVLRVACTAAVFVSLFAPLSDIKGRSLGNFDQPCRLHVEFTRGKCDGESAEYTRFTLIHYARAYRLAAPQIVVLVFARVGSKPDLWFR